MFEVGGIKNPLGCISLKGKKPPSPKNKAFKRKIID